MFLKSLNLKVVCQSGMLFAPYIHIGHVCYIILITWCFLCSQVAANLQKIVDDPQNNRNVTFKLVRVHNLILQLNAHYNNVVLPQHKVEKQASAVGYFLLVQSPWPGSRELTLSPCVTSCLYLPGVWTGGIWDPWWHQTDGIRPAQHQLTHTETPPSPPPKK